MRYKFLRWVIPALMLMGFVPSAQSAWNYEQVKWKHWSMTSAGGALYAGLGSFVNDTTFVPAFGGRTDTTAAWNMLEAEPSPTGGVSIGGATADSSQVGALVVAADSLVASTLLWAATTCQFQVNYGSNSSGWTSVGSAISPLPTTTQKAAYFPMWNLPVLTAHLGSTANNQAYTIFAPNVRAIITWGTSAAVPSARVYVRKWLGSGIIQTPRSAQQVNP